MMKSHYIIFKVLKSFIYLALFSATVLFTVLIFNLLIEKYFGRSVLKIVFFGSFGILLTSGLIMAISHTMWHNKVNKREWVKDDIYFLIDAYSCRVIPNYNAPAYIGADIPDNHDKIALGSQIVSMIIKIDPAFIKAAKSEQRSKIASLLRSDDVKVVEVTLDLIERTKMIEALPLICQLLLGKLRTSGDYYIMPIAKNVEAILVQHKQELRRNAKEELLRSSEPSNALLLRPLSTQNQTSSDELLRPSETEN